MPEAAESDQAGQIDLHSLTLEQLIPEWDRIERLGLPGVRALVLRDRFYLLVRAMGRVDMLHPWIYARCREVEKAPDGYLDLWAREHYKSTIITIGGSIQELLKDSSLTIGIFSHTSPDAKSFLAVIKRELENNQILKAAFPDVLWENPWKDAPAWSLDGGIILRRQTNPKECSVEAHGLIDGMPTGKHFGLLVYDDVVTEKSVSTPEQIEKATTAWELSDNLGKSGGRKWHIGTRYSYADSYESILKRGSVIPRIYTATHNAKLDGKPVLFSQEEWEKKQRDQGPNVIASQMMQDPLSGKQRMFDVGDFGVYEVRPEVLNVYILCDPARSKKKDSANTAVAVVGVDYAMNKYLLDGVNHKMDLKERWEAIRNLYNKWVREITVCKVEVGYEKYGAQADLDYFEERMKAERVRFDIKELAWPHEGDGSKVDRVQRIGPDLRNHRIYLPYPTNKEKLTSLQRDMNEKGYGYRIAQMIRKKDENGVIYDLTEQLKVQTNFFPYGGLKDLVDAYSRIHDMEVTAPSHRTEEDVLEPEYT